MTDPKPKAGGAGGGTPRRPPLGHWLVDTMPRGANLDPPLREEVGQGDSVRQGRGGVGGCPVRLALSFPQKSSCPDLFRA